MKIVIKTIWNKWKAMAKIIALFQARIILTLFYFTFLLPFGLIFSLTKDMLLIHTPVKNIWKNKENQSETMEEMKRQF